MQKNKKIKTVNTKKPKRHVTHVHHYDEFLVAGLISFPFIAFFIAPFFHELFHMLVLKYYHCSYFTDFGISLFDGLYATIDYHCILEKNPLVLLYLSGVLATLFIGFSLLLIDWYLTRKNYLEYSIFTSFIAMGFLFSPVIYFFREQGDLVNAFDVMGINTPSYFFPLIGTMIMVLSLIYFWYNLRFTSAENLLEEEKEDLDCFGAKKTKKEDHHRYMPK